MTTETIAQGSESGVMAALFPLLQTAISDLPNSKHLTLCDSQEHKWLPQDAACPEMNFLKPDGCVIHKAFVSPGAHKPALKRLFPCLRSIVEGKQNDAVSNAAMGQALTYAEKLKGDIDILHVSCVCSPLSDPLSALL